MTMKILIAEDDEFLLKALDFKLSKDGYDVIKAKDGREVKQVLDAGNIPDIIVTDIMMPYFTGLEVISYVRKNFQEKPIPIIALSAVGLEKTILEAFSMGADDFITKPFSPNELLIRIKKLIPE